MTEKEFGLVPCGDKSLKIPPCIQPENGREEQHAEHRGLFLQGMKRKFVFLKQYLLFLVYKTKNHTQQQIRCCQNTSIWNYQRAMVCRIIIAFYILALLFLKHISIDWLLYDITLMRGVHLPFLCVLLSCDPLVFVLISFMASVCCF